ncbi:hypothetical protein MMC34_002468 [Xylographa carneopallida]|nr:hypothetical protein [Xylographa carneopallida]
MAQTTTIQVDVLICGGGPVGLLLSYQLARMGIKTYTVEQYDKSTQGMYGRACALYPRTLEMLDQLDLGEALAQIGFIGRSAVTYRDGKRINGRGWGFINKPFDTFFDYCLNIRQKYSENVFRDAAEGFGSITHSSTKLIGFTIDENSADYKITAELQQNGGEKMTVQSKYIIGADGGRSTVRSIAEIPFVGEKIKDESMLHWVRIDAVVKTSMPGARLGYGSIESRQHGNILWVAVDHGRTRIGYSIPPEVYKKHGEHITEDVVKEEAVKALAPFELEFVTLDWWTLYTIGQRVADSFRAKERILLAGDAGHTHSSGAAQGMNTGMHDAVNLGWKLGGVLKGWYTDSVLGTYSTERRAVAQELIELDKNISVLISGRLPPGQTGDPDQLFGELLESSAQFTTGIGVHYEANTLNTNRESSISAVQPGWRVPDVLVRRPGSKFPSRFQQITKNNGKLWIVVFAGSPIRTLPKLQALREYIDGPQSFTARLTEAFTFITVIAGPGVQADEVLGVKRFGDAFYDVDETAHVRLGIPADEGAVLVLRPDGILGFAAGLEEGARLAEYLETFVTPKVQK